MKVLFGGEWIPAVVNDTAGWLAVVSEARAYGQSGATWEPLKLDRATNCLPGVDFAHHEIHAGDSFAAGTYATTAVIGESLVVGFRTPNTTKWGHMLLESDVALKSFMKIEEAVTTWATAVQGSGSSTLSSAGTDLTVFNRDRNSSEVTGFTASHSTFDGITLGATKASPTLDPFITLPVHQFGGKKTAGGIRSVDEYILKQNTEYLITLEAIVAANALCLHLNWYEHSNNA